MDNSQQSKFIIIIHSRLIITQRRSFFNSFYFIRQFKAHIQTFHFYFLILFLLIATFQLYLSFNASFFQYSQIIFCFLLLFRGVGAKKNILIYLHMYSFFIMFEVHFGVAVVDASRLRMAAGLPTASELVCTCFFLKLLCRTRLVQHS